MRNKVLLYLLFAVVLTSAGIFSGCSGSPGSSVKNEQYEEVRKNVKSILGDEYDAVNFVVSQEGYTNEAKTEYEVNATFDLNKPYMFFEGKKIPLKLSFRKEDGKWTCIFNSANVAEFFNLFGK